MTIKAKIRKKEKIIKKIKEKIDNIIEQKKKNKCRNFFTKKLGSIVFFYAIVAFVTYGILLKANSYLNVPMNQSFMQSYSIKTFCLLSGLSITFNGLFFPRKVRKRSIKLKKQKNKLIKELEKEKSLLKELKAQLESSKRVNMTNNNISQNKNLSLQEKIELSLQSDIKKDISAELKKDFIPKEEIKSQEALSFIEKIELCLQEDIDKEVITKEERKNQETLSFKEKIELYLQEDISSLKSSEKEINFTQEANIKRQEMQKFKERLLKIKTNTEAQSSYLNKGRKRVIG